MKKSLLKLCLVAITAISLHAEADFDTVQNLIGSGKYQQALDSLKVIAKNHPNSAKVQYTLAQAQAGVGNLPAAKDALDRAKAIDPELKFVSKGQVQELSEVINSVRVIKKVENSSHWFLWFIAVSSCLGAVWHFFFRGKKETGKEPVKTETPRTTTYSYKREEPAKTERPERSSFSDYGYNRTAAPDHRETVREVRDVREVHHYHDTRSNSGLDTLGSVAVAAGTAAVVSSMMNNHSNYDSHNNSGHAEHTTVNNYNYSTINETESSNVSDSWEDERETVSKSWDSPSDNSSSDSWDSDDSSSSSDSWDE